MEICLLILDCISLLCFPRLCLCEKALAEYLDTKRLAFPRFYFISSADLLDILSNGTNPQLVSFVQFIFLFPNYIDNVIAD